MASDELITQMLTRLERVEQANRQLAAQVETLRGRGAQEEEEPPDGRDLGPSDDSAHLARRGLLKRVGGMALGVTAVSAAGQLVSAPSAAAADGQPIIMGAANESSKPTSYTTFNLDTAALAVQNNGHANGIGLVVGAKGRAGIIGVCPENNTGLLDRAGVAGIGAGVTGVLGTSDTESGVKGVSETKVGVLGASKGVSGVRGHCQNDGATASSAMGRSM